MIIKISVVHKQKHCGMLGALTNLLSAFPRPCSAGSQPYMLQLNVATGRRAGARKVPIMINSP